MSRSTVRSIYLCSHNPCLITKCVCYGMPGPHTSAVAKISCCWAVCEESHFYSLPFGQAEANTYFPNIISTSCKNFLMSRLISQFFCNLNSSRNFTCLSGKLITEFTSPIAKSTSPRLMNTTFFAHCWVYAVSCW